jgi:hypothetical protein
VPAIGKTREEKSTSKPVCVCMGWEKQTVRERATNHDGINEYGN